jgi:hypothetical protein
VPDDIRLYMFECGIIKIPRYVVNVADALNQERVDNPTPWFLITHPRGNVIIDGGNAPQVAEDPIKHWGPLAERSPVDHGARPGRAARARAHRRGPGEHPLGRPEPPAHRPHRRARGHRPPAQRRGARHAHRVRHRPQPADVGACRILPGRLRQAGRAVEPARGLRGRLRPVRRRDADLLAHPGPHGRAPVLRGAPAQRRRVPARHRRREHDRPPQRDAVARVRALGRRGSPLGAPPAPAGLALAGGGRPGARPLHWPRFKLAPEHYT